MNLVHEYIYLVLSASVPLLPIAPNYNITADKSRSMSESGESFRDLIQPVIEHQAELVDLKEEIDAAMSSQFSDPDLDEVSLVTEAIFDILTISIPEDKREDVAGAFLYSIYNFNSEVLRIYFEEGANDDFGRLLSLLSSKYQMELGNLGLRTYQGEHYWRNITSEYVLRNESFPGINHRISLGDGSTLELTTSITSHTKFIEYLLEQEVLALEQFEEKGTEQINSENIELLQNHIDALRQKVTKFE